MSLRGLFCFVPIERSIGRPFPVTCHGELQYVKLTIKLCQEARSPVSLPWGLNKQQVFNKASKKKLEGQLFCFQSPVLVRGGFP